MSVIQGSSTLRTECIQRLRDDRQTNIRMAALLVTVVLHGLVFWWGMNSARLGASSPERIQAIRVFLQPLALPELAAVVRPHRALPPAASPALPPTPAVLPRVATPPSPPASPAISPTPVVAAPATPSNSEVAAVSLAPLPVAAPVVVPAPVAAVASAVTVSQPVAGESGASHPTTTVNASSGGGQAAGAAVANVAVAPGARGGAAGSGKELYLQALFTHIEAHKYYPPSARRRQLEGQVRVSFTIEPGGGVSNLKASEGHPQLEEAALQTVRSALPLPLPAGGVTLPFNLSYHMDFRLR